MQDFLHTLARKAGLTASRCPVCGVVMQDSNDPICNDCSDELAPRLGGYCPTCGDISGITDAPPSQCPECRHTPPPWGTLSFHNVYKDTLRGLILSYKFNGNFGRTNLLANLAWQSFTRTSTRTPDLIVPVPLHTRRLLKRGFNQSTEICRILGKNIDRPVLNHGLQRIRNTPPQTRLGLEDRQTNIKDAFIADADQIRKKTILLVDDVYTTGATLRECARTLRRAGASGVDVLVLARAVQD